MKLFLKESARFIAFAICILSGGAILILLSGCSTTQQARVNAAATTLAKDAAVVQSDLAKYGPTIAALTTSISGSNAKAQKQVSAVTTDAAAYANDAQTLAQIIADLTAQPSVSGT